MDWLIIRYNPKIPARLTFGPNGTVLTADDASPAGMSWQPVSGGGGPHASSHKHGGLDEVATATPAANAIPKAGAGGMLAVGWIPALPYDPAGSAAAAGATAQNTALARAVAAQWLRC